ncbi:MAG: hypothetical protein FJZ56_06400 [Chlamydiae bacterium]|nr:hypothetical protein [Chlamydiota bacterium]
MDGFSDRILEKMQEIPGLMWLIRSIVKKVIKEYLPKKDHALIDKVTEDFFKHFPKEKIDEYLGEITDRHVSR